MLEEYRGGMNSFVHLSVPDEVAISIEESKLECNHCGRLYYNNDISSAEHNIHIEKFVPEDGHCYDCGSADIKRCGDPVKLENTLKSYNTKKDELLPFYSHHGLLVDFELRNGYDDFPRLKEQI